MPQPPVRPVMARGLVRAIPFVTPIIQIVPALANAGVLTAEFDTLEGFADDNSYAIVGAYPGVNVAKPHAVGPLLDAFVFADQITWLDVFFAVDRGGVYRAVTPTTVIPASTFMNISGLRVTGRFAAVQLTNKSGGAAAAVEFGVYMRSA